MPLSEPMLCPHVAPYRLICDRVSMDEHKEFLHGDYIGVSHSHKTKT